MLRDHYGTPMSRDPAEECERAGIPTAGPVRLHRRSATLETWLAEMRPRLSADVAPGALPVVTSTAPTRGLLRASQGRETCRAAAERLGISHRALKARAVAGGHLGGLLPSQWDVIVSTRKPTRRAVIGAECEGSRAAAKRLGMSRKTLVQRARHLDTANGLTPAQWDALAALPAKCRTAPGRESPRVAARRTGLGRGVLERLARGIPLRGGLLPSQWDELARGAR